MAMYFLKSYVMSIYVFKYDNKNIKIKTGSELWRIKTYNFGDLRAPAITPATQVPAFCLRHELTTLESDPSAFPKQNTDGLLTIIPRVLIPQFWNLHFWIHHTITHLMDRQAKLLWRWRRQRMTLSWIFQRNSRSFFHASELGIYL